MLKKVLIMGVVNVILFYALSIFVLRDGEINWGLIYLTHKKSLAEQVTKRKVLILGDSSALYGFDSQTLTNATGVEVLNLAVSGGFSSDFNMRYVDGLLNPGDAILYSAPIENLHSASSAEKYDFHYFRLFEPRELFSVFQLGEILKFPWYTNLINSMLTSAKYYGRLALKGQYAPPELTPRGDYGVCSSEWLGDNLEMGLSDITASNAYFSQLATYAEKLKKRHVSLIFVWGPRIKTEFYNDEWMAEGDRLVAEFKNSPIKLFSHPGDALFEKSYFCNSAHHLNLAGAKYRSQLMAQHLRDLLHARGSDSAEADTLRTNHPTTNQTSEAKDGDF